MVFLASSLLKLGRFPLSRYKFVFDQVHDRAQALDIPAIVALAEHAVARTRDAMELDHRQRAQRPTKFPAGTRELDELVDAAVNGLDSYCESQIALFHGEERAAIAARIRHALLPSGIGEITQLPYADQHVQVNALLARAQEPDMLPDLAILPEIAVILTRLRELNTRYGERLHDRVEVLTRQDVRTHHDACHELLCALACLIIGHFAALPERRADRDHLLDPILRQNEALRQRRRRRRANGNAGDDTPDNIVAEPDEDIDPADPMA